MPNRLDVLLIEDHRDGAAYIGRLLQREDEPVVLEWASRFETGLKRLADGGLDAALINLQQPEHAPLEVLAAAREHNEDVPIVVLTTLDEVETAAEAVRQGAQDFVVKEHLDSDLLYRAIHNAIDRRSVAGALRDSQQAAQDSDARVRAIVNASLDCIITLDDHGKIVDFNPAAERTFGYSRTEVIGQDMAELLMPAATADRQRRNFEAYQRQGEGSILGTRIETPAVRKNGEEFIAEMGTQPVPYQNKLVFTIFLRDITDRKHAEEELKRYSAELERSNRDLDQYASVVSHDLLAPLRGVSGFSELLKRDYHGQLDDRANEYLKSIAESVERMRTLVEDLRAYARVATAAKPFERLDCHHVAERAIDDLEVEILESGAEVKLDTLPVVEADKTQLTQLFQNLIGNAIKYRGEAAPKIHVTASNLGDEWRICVRDNGIGIPRDKTSHIFEIFQRLHGDESNYAGTGIGLAICKRIVQRHHGRIWVESEAGEGSAFYFTIPTNSPDRS